MHTHFKLSFTVAAAVLLLSTSLWAQSPLTSSTGSLVRSSTAAAADPYRDSSLKMIENRARTLGNKTSGSATRYWVVKDSDLIGKKPQEVLDRLSPTTITAQDRVRKLEILVDLRHPITLYTGGKQPASIGTATVNGQGINNIEVHASIFMSSPQVVPK